MDGGLPLTFVHTGPDSSIGERLRRVRRHVQREEMFLANYADVLTNAPLDAMAEQFRTPIHCLDVTDYDRVTSISTLQETPLWENGGYLVFRREIFDHLPVNGDLVTDVCRPLALQGRMLAYRHHGFWQPVDTVKERTALEAAHQDGTRPWIVWEEPARTRRDPLQVTVVDAGPGRTPAPGADAVLPGAATR